MNGQTVKAQTAKELTTRRLAQSDFAAIADLYHSTERWMETPISPEFIEDSLETIRKEYLSDEPCQKYLMGVFEGDRLILSGGLFFWTAVPFCTFLRLVGDGKGMESKNFLNGMVLLYDALLNEIEARECSRFYLLTTARHLAAMAQLGRLFPRLRDNYLMTVEEIVKPGTKPKFRYAWIMMGEKVWPVSLVIRAGTAYNHNRSFDRSEVSDEVLNAWAPDNQPNEKSAKR